MKHVIHHNKSRIKTKITTPRKPKFLKPNVIPFHHVANHTQTPKTKLSIYALNRESYNPRFKGRYFTYTHFTQFISITIWALSYLNIGILITHFLMLLYLYIFFYQ